MSTLGIIGTGSIGGALARLAVDAGLDVVVSNSRGPHSLEGLVASLGERARAATPAEAAAAADWVVVSVPLVALSAMPVDELAGKIVLDTTNYYPSRDGRIAALDSGEQTASEIVQAHLVGARVVKAFNTVSDQHLAPLARAAGAADRTAIPVAGDDRAAVAEAATLIDLLGFDAVDAGTLAESWRFEPETAPYSMPYFAAPDVAAAGFAKMLESLQRGEAPEPLPADAGAPVSADALRALLAQSTRVLTADRILA